MRKLETIRTEAGKIKEKQLHKEGLRQTLHIIE